MYITMLRNILSILWLVAGAYGTPYNQNLTTWYRYLTSQTHHHVRKYLQRYVKMNS